MGLVAFETVKDNEPTEPGKILFLPPAIFPGYTRLQLIAAAATAFAAGFMAGAIL